MIPSNRTAKSFDQELLQKKIIGHVNVLPIDRKKLRLPFSIGRKLPCL